MTAVYGVIDTAAVAASIHAGFSRTGTIETAARRSCSRRVCPSCDAHRSEKFTPIICRKAAVETRLAVRPGILPSAPDVPRQPGTRAGQLHRHHPAPGCNEDKQLSAGHGRDQQLQTNCSCTGLARWRGPSEDGFLIAERRSTRSVIRCKSGLSSPKSRRDARGESKARFGRSNTPVAHRAAFLRANITLTITSCTRYGCLGCLRDPTL